jgi:hypothetical protein
MKKTFDIAQFGDTTDPTGTDTTDPTGTDTTDPTGTDTTDPTGTDTTDPTGTDTIAANGTDVTSGTSGSPTVVPAKQVAVVDPFPSDAYPTAFHVNDPHLLNAMTALAGIPGINALCGALVDLTGSPAVPKYAGLKDEEMVFPGSLQKISAMYAALELRSRVRSYVSTAIDNGFSLTRGWEQTIIKQIEVAWKPKLAAAFPTLPKAFPQLGQIFAFSSDGDVDFTEDSSLLSDDDLDAIGEFGTPRGKFRDWMRLMLRWSNNVAASKCVLALSYPYINGALKSAGFIDDSLQNGLWMSGDYTGRDWIPNSSSQPQANRAGRALTPRWATAQGRRLSNFTATASQLARLTTLLAQDQLIDQASSLEMRDLMSGAQGIGSYVKSALESDNRAPDWVISKIGYGDDKRSHDCAIVERTESGTALRYVVVGLGFKRDDRSDLERLFVELDKIIVSLHP